MKKYSLKRVICFIISLLMVMAMLPLNSVFADSGNIAAGSKAYVATGLNFREGPGMNSRIKSVLKKDTEITVLGKSGSWYNVRLGNGDTGYVHGDYIFSFDSNLIGGKSARTTTRVNVRSGAGTGYKILTTLGGGSTVTLLGKQNAWFKIRSAGGTEGYVYGKYLSATTSSASPVTLPAADNSKPAANNNVPGKIESDMILATTTSTQDTGLLDVLVPAFEKKYNVSVKTVAVGTGEAIEMGKRGDADVVLVHARSSEDAFVASGYGVNRKDVMYNEFFLVGPADDPAGVAETKTAVEAFKKIAEEKAAFISRGDNSGTHKKELSIWSKCQLSPSGQTDTWYTEAGQGMGATLTMANEMNAYTLVDSGTWYAFMDKVDLKIVAQGDTALFNPYGVIAVNPEKYPNIHYNAAMAFINFITSEEGQKIIGDYRKNGHQLFIPSAK